MLIALATTTHLFSLHRYLKFIDAKTRFSCKVSHFVKASMCLIITSWWRHQMETFSALLALCVGNSPVPGEFPSQRRLTRSFDVFFDLGLNKPMGKQLLDWWFDTPSRSLWRHCNDWHNGNTLQTSITPIERYGKLPQPQYIYIIYIYYIHENIF